MMPLFGPVGVEVVIILFLLVLLFGTKRIPRAAREVGKSLGEFKRGAQEGGEDD